MTSPTPVRYRHYKGNEYTVLGVVRHSESLEELVLYRQEYGDHGLWVRPKEMFSQTVKIEGQDVPRFQFVGAEQDEQPNLFANIPSNLPHELFDNGPQQTQRPNRTDRFSRPIVTRRLLVRSRPR